MASTGSIFKRCGCTETTDGKRRQLGKHCPKLRRADGTWNPRHGSWSFTTSVRGAGGKRRQVMRGGFANQAEAQRELDALRDRARRGMAVVDRPDLASFLADWLKSKTDIRPSTHRAYASHIRLYLSPLLGYLMVDELRVGHVADAFAEVPGSDANRQRVRATLRSALADAARQGLVLNNPAALVKLPAGKRPRALVWTREREERWREAVARLEASSSTDPNRATLEAAAQPPSPVMVWRPDQLGAFLDHAHEDRLYALWHVIAHIGLRRGEACGLRWQDVSLEDGSMTVHVQLVQLGREVVESPTKSGAGERAVALDQGTVAVLRSWRLAQRAERLAWGESWDDSGRVFTREDGSHLRPEWVSDRFERLTREAGLPPIRLHDLRHGAASLMLAAGVELVTVKETLGHSAIAITADTYTSVFQEVATAAAEATAALVPRKGRR